MKNRRSLLTGFLALCLFPSLGKASFERDYPFFKQALRLSNLPDSRVVDFYLNPYFGLKRFRLSAQDAPWAGNYFPMVDGGIANRWQNRTTTKFFDVTGAVLPDVSKLRPDEIHALSPAEKYDIWQGNDNFAATLHELKNRGPHRSLPVQDWEGFCNGVRCAGINLPEPIKPVQVKSPSGKIVIFEPADLKALAGASYFYVEKYAQIGAPSRELLAESQPDPAVFDLALRYYLGKRKESFVIDSNLGPEIWNESVIGYERTLTPLPLSSVVLPAATTGVVSVVRVGLTLETLGEVSIGQSNRPTEKAVAAGEVHQSMDVSYLYVFGRQKKNARRTLGKQARGNERC